MEHIVLSPHHDDAPLSCGGMIHRLVHRGTPVQVLTVMAADMPEHLQITPFIQSHLDRWRTALNVVEMRRAEDRRAVEMLGARMVFGPYPDLLYRADAKGEPLYNSRPELFGAIHPDDPVWEQRALMVEGLDAAARIYVPLGVGHHVDHQLVRDIALWWSAEHPDAQIVFYEDYPYAVQAPDAVAHARELLPFETTPEIVELDEAALAAKIASIACYESQIKSFWPDVETMAGAIRAYAEQVGQGVLAERLWLRAH